MSFQNLMLLSASVKKFKSQKEKKEKPKHLFDIIKEKMKVNGS